MLYFFVLDKKLNYNWGDKLQEYLCDFKYIYK